ncbi:MAG: SCO family protein [Deltaproteobacteria bacterium]
MKRNKILIISLTVLLLILIGWGVILYKIYDIKGKSDFYGHSFEREAPEFTLTDQNGSKVSLSDFKGKLVLLFFGYTHCPDICPVTMSTLNSMVDQLGEDKDEVQVLFITIDPERDDQEALRNYVPYFNESFIGLTGTPEEIELVAKSFGAFYMKEESDSTSGYLMGHTSSIYLIDPNGMIILRYPQAKMDPEEIAKDVKRIL